MNPRYIIGIDPGVNTGIAVYDKQHRPAKLIILQTTGFWECYDFIRQTFLPQHCVIYCEDSSKNAPTFDHNVIPATIAQRKKREKISQNVGSNKREGRLLIEGLQRRGYSVIAVQPIGRKGTKRKWTHKQLIAMTKWGEAHSSEHSRDAAMIAFGR